MKRVMLVLASLGLLTWCATRARADDVVVYPQTSAAVATPAQAVVTPVRWYGGYYGGYYGRPGVGVYVGPRYYSGYTPYSTYYAPAYPAYSYPAYSYPYYPGYVYPYGYYVRPGIGFGVRIR